MKTKLQREHRGTSSTTSLYPLSNSPSTDGIVLVLWKTGLVVGIFCGAAAAPTPQEPQPLRMLQLEVFGFVDHTHPASPELLEDAIVRDGLADHGGFTLLGAENFEIAGAQR
jgi:hypothetical protein